MVQWSLDAGASVRGKTHLDQFVCGLTGTRSPFGAVPDALNPAYVSGGSSSGSAHVVATGQVDCALAAQPYAAVRGFFDAHADEVIVPVRSIIAAGRGYSAADLVQAQAALRGYGQEVDAMWADIDVLLVPTAPAHYTIAALRADGLPFGITLIGQCASDWQLAVLGQRYHHAVGLPQGASAEAF